MPGSTAPYRNGRSLLTADGISPLHLRLALYAIDHDNLPLFKAAVELPCDATLMCFLENLPPQEPQNAPAGFSTLDDFVAAASPASSLISRYSTYRQDYPAQQRLEMANKTVKIGQILYGSDADTMCELLECQGVAAARALLLGSPTPEGLDPVPGPVPVPMFRALNAPWGPISLFEYAQLVKPEKILRYMRGIYDRLAICYPEGTLRPTYDQAWRQELSRKLLQHSANDGRIIPLLHYLQQDTLPEDKPQIASRLGCDLKRALLRLSRKSNGRDADQEMLRHVFREPSILSGDKQRLTRDYLDEYGVEGLQRACCIVVLSKPLIASQKEKIESGEYLVVRKAGSRFFLAFFNKKANQHQEQEILDEDMLRVLQSVPEGELRNDQLQYQLFEWVASLGGDARLQFASDFAHEMCFYLKSELCDILDKNALDEKTAETLPKNCLQALAILEGYSEAEVKQRVESLWSLLNDLERGTHFVKYSVYQSLRVALLRGINGGVDPFVSLERLLWEDDLLAEEKEADSPYACEFVVDRSFPFAGKTFYVSNHMDADDGGFEVLRTTREKLVYELLQVLHATNVVGMQGTASETLCKQLSEDYKTLLLAGALDDIATPEDWVAKESKEDAVHKRHCQDVENLSHFVRHYIGGKGALPLSVAQWYVAQHKILCHFVTKDGEAPVTGNYHQHLEDPGPGKPMDRWGRVLVHYPNGVANKQGPRYAHFVSAEEDGFSAATFNAKRQGQAQICMLRFYEAYLRCLYLYVSEGLKPHTVAIAAERVKRYFQRAHAAGMSGKAMSLLHKPVFFEPGKPGVIGAKHDLLLDMIDQRITGRELALKIQQQMIMKISSAPTAADQAKVVSGEWLIVIQGQHGSFRLGCRDAANQYQERPIEDPTLTNRLRYIPDGPINDSTLEDSTPIRDIITERYRTDIHYEDHTLPWGAPAHDNQVGVDVMDFTAQTSSAAVGLLQANEIPLYGSQRDALGRINGRLLNVQDQSEFEQVRRRGSMQDDIRTFQALRPQMETRHTQTQEFLQVSTALSVMAVGSAEQEASSTKIVLFPSKLVSQSKDNLQDFYSKLCEEMRILEETNHDKTTRRMCAFTQEMPDIHQNFVQDKYDFLQPGNLNAPEDKTALPPDGAARAAKRKELAILLTNYYREQIACIKPKDLRKFVKYLAKMVFTYRCEIGDINDNWDGLIDWLDYGIMPDGRYYKAPPGAELSLLSGPGTCIQLIRYSGHKLYRLCADQLVEELCYGVLTDEIQEIDIGRFSSRIARSKQVQWFAGELPEVCARSTWYARYGQLCWLDQTTQDIDKTKRAQHLPIPDEFAVQTNQEEAKIAVAVAQQVAPTAKALKASQDEVVQLKGELKVSQEQVTNLETQVRGSRQEIVDLKTQASDRKQEISDLQTHLTQAQTQLQTQGQEISQLRTLLEQVVKQQSEQQQKHGQGGGGPH